MARRRCSPTRWPGSEVSWATSSGDDAPHWSVTFAVSDTDAVVARAEQLGGRVIDPPTDTPPVRTARLADPQGAIFTVSKYDPGSS